jgi:hypothetical protein
MTPALFTACDALMARVNRIAERAGPPCHIGDRNGVS